MTKKGYDLCSRLRCVVTYRTNPGATVKWRRNTRNLISRNDHTKIEMRWSILWLRAGGGEESAPTECAPGQLCCNPEFYWRWFLLHYLGRAVVLQYLMPLGAGWHFCGEFMMGEFLMNSVLTLGEPVHRGVEWEVLKFWHCTGWMRFVWTGHRTVMP